MPNRFECPVCGRYFQNIDAHVASKHPDFGREVIDGQTSLLATTYPAPVPPPRKKRGFT